MKVQHFLQWTSRRVKIIIATIILALGTILIWNLNSDSSQASVITVKIAAISALFAAISSIATLIQAVEIQKQRESLERPYIIIFFEIRSSGEIDFFIQNIGNSPALNIIIKFAKPTPTDFAKRPLGDFEKPISFLPPEKSIRQFMGYGHSLLNEENPTKFRATIRYSSVYKEMFAEEIEQDFAYLRQVTFPQKSIEDSLEIISRDLSRLVSNLSASSGLWSPPPIEHSLNVIAQDVKKLTEHVLKPPIWKSILDSIFKSNKNSA